MDTQDVGPDVFSPAGTGRRTASRSRRLLALALVGVLGWTGVSFLAGTGGTSPTVSVLPGASANGSVADVHGLTDTVTTGKGKQVGVKLARIDVAETYQTKIRVTLVWQNPNEFAKNTGTSFWQVRLGLYYPVRANPCTSGDPDWAVTVNLQASESYPTPQAAQVFCAYRDKNAIGPGAVTSAGADQGTQLLATNWLLGSLRPQTVLSNPQACGPTGSVPCLPSGLGAARRTYFVIGTLLNPGPNPPPGQIDNLLAMRFFVRASKVGA